MFDIDRDSIPRVGRRIDGVEYVDRHGVYALIRDADSGHLAIVRAGGHLHLPGGGANAGESPHETLHRELREECGRPIRIGRELGRVVEYVTTGSGRHLARRCHYFEASFVDGPRCAPEPDHELLWLPARQAEEQLAIEAHRWVVRRLREANGAAWSAQ